MKIVKGLIGVVSILVAIVAIGIAVAIVGRWFFSLKPEVIAAIAGVGGLLLVPIITYFTTRSLDHRRSRESAIREQKTVLYDSVIRGLLNMLNLGKEEDGMQADETLGFFAEVAPPLITYGSREVILAWNSLLRNARAQNNSQNDPLETMLSFEALMTSMRQDLGHDVRRQSKGELLAIFINDIDTLLPPPAK